MKSNDGCAGCERCANGGACLCKMIGGIIIAIVVLSIVFSVAKSVLGMAFGTATWPTIPQLVMGLIVLIVVIWVITWAVRLPFRAMHGFGRRDIRILRKRYARGEITEAQFKKMMKNLKE